MTSKNTDELLASSLLELSNSKSSTTTSKRKSKNSNKDTTLSTACNRCKKSKVKCDGGIPCHRCIRLGYSKNCKLSIPAKRGRKRKSNEISSSSINKNNNEFVFTHTGKRILSIQSSVVYGYVGQKVSLLPLQLGGYDVDPINTVQLSNHTGYKKFTGKKYDGDSLDTLINGLYDNDFLKSYNCVITGYIGNVSFLKSVIKTINMMKSINSQLFILCDPVIGDNGKLYVTDELVPLYRDELIPIATMITPNQTEAEHLCNTKINTIIDAFHVCKKFQDMGPDIVIITSCFLNTDPNHIISVASCKSELDKCLVLRVPKFDYYLSGTGDLCSSLLTRYYNDSNNNLTSFYQLKNTLEFTMSTVFDIVKRTVEANSNELKFTESIPVLMSSSKAQTQLKAEILHIGGSN